MESLEETQWWLLEESVGIPLEESQGEISGELIAAIFGAIHKELHQRFLEEFLKKFIKKSLKKSLDKSQERNFRILEEFQVSGESFREIILTTGSKPRQEFL